MLSARSEFIRRFGNVRISDPTRLGNVPNAQDVTARCVGGALRRAAGGAKASWRGFPAGGFASKGAWRALRQATFALRHEGFAPRHAWRALRHETFAPRHPPFAPRHEAFAPRHAIFGPLCGPNPASCGQNAGASVPPPSLTPPSGRSGSRCGSSWCRWSRGSGPRGDSAGSSSGRRGTSRPW